MLKTHPLSQSLLKTWSDYQKRVHQCRAKNSVKNIHQLRISTQKLEAILTLAHRLKSNHKSKSVIFLIKKVRKSLGPLRDNQVESATFQSTNKNLSKFLLIQKMNAKKKANKSLKNISLKHDGIYIKKLAKDLIGIESRKSRMSIKAELDEKVKSSISDLEKTMKHLNPKRAKITHRFRIHAKKLRYQAEILNTLSDKSPFELANLKAAQEVTGRFQNNRVLLKTIDQFLSKKKHAHNSKVLLLKKRIEKNQKKLIKKDFKELSAKKW